MLYWLIKHLIAGPYVQSTFRPWSTGTENIPRTGAAILVANHLSEIDSIFLPLIIDRRISFLAKSEYFTGKGLKGWIVRSMLTNVGQISMDRSGGKASEASLQTGLELLRAGGVLGIYPEGTRSPTGKLYRGRTGIARMILESGAPVIPIGLIDTDKAMPIGRRLPKVHRVGVVIGEPLDFSRFAGLESDRFILRSITDEIMIELARLSGQEYVDVYASTLRKKAVAA